MVFGLNAENYTFATLADMHAATDLKDGDIVTITEDVVFEYFYMYYFVVSDKNGAASCMNSYCYYIGKIVETNSLKAGDILKNYSGEIVVSASGVYRLEPVVDTKNKVFGSNIVIEHSDEEYEVKTTMVTIKELLENPAIYDGKVVSLDVAETKNIGHTSYLIQGEDTLKNFVISGLNNDAYPTEIVVHRALFKVESSERSSPIFKNVKALKSTALTDSIQVDLNVQVLRKEVYEGKTYLTVYEGKGDNFWCVIFPNLCLINPEEEHTYKSYFKDLPHNCKVTCLCKMAFQIRQKGFLGWIKSLFSK